MTLLTLGSKPGSPYGDGNSENWKDQIREWQELGATLFSVNTLNLGYSTPAEHLKALRNFATTVGPFSELTTRRASMKAMNNFGLIVFAVWIITRGIIELFNLSIPSMGLILPILAIFAGVLVLLRIRDLKAVINLGFLFLSIWLILTGLIPLIGVTFPEMAIVMSVLGLAAGVFLLIGQ